MTEEAKQSEPGEIVFIGACILAGGKLGSGFLPIHALDKLSAEDGEVASRASSAFDIKPNLVVGGVYRASIVLEDDAVRRIGPDRQFLRRADHPLVTAWELNHRATELKKSRELAEKKVRANPVAMGEIEALAALYYRTRPGDRLMFETAVVELIRIASGRMTTERLRANAERLGLSQ